MSSTPPTPTFTPPVPPASLFKSFKLSSLRIGFKSVYAALGSYLDHVFTQNPAAPGAAVWTKIKESGTHVRVEEMYSALFGVPDVPAEFSTADKINRVMNELFAQINWLPRVVNFDFNTGTNMLTFRSVTDTNMDNMSGDIVSETSWTTVAPGRGVTATTLASVNVQSPPHDKRDVNSFGLSDAFADDDEDKNNDDLRDDDSATVIGDDKDLSFDSSVDKSTSIGMVTPARGGGLLQKHEKKAIIRAINSNTLGDADIELLEKWVHDITIKAVVNDKAIETSIKAVEKATDQLQALTREQSKILVRHKKDVTKSQEDAIAAINGQANAHIQEITQQLNDANKTIKELRAVKDVAQHYQNELQQVYRKHNQTMNQQYADIEKHVEYYLDSISHHTEDEKNQYRAWLKRVDTAHKIDVELNKVENSMVLLKANHDLIEKDRAELAELKNDLQQEKSELMEFKESLAALIQDINKININENIDKAASDSKPDQKQSKDAVAPAPDASKGAPDKFIVDWRKNSKWTGYYDEWVIDNEVVNGSLIDAALAKAVLKVVDNNKPATGTVPVHVEQRPAPIPAGSIIHYSNPHYEAHPPGVHIRGIIMNPGGVWHDDFKEYMYTVMDQDGHLQENILGRFIKVISFDEYQQSLLARVRGGGGSPDRSVQHTPQNRPHFTDDQGLDGTQWPYQNEYDYTSPSHHSSGRSTVPPHQLAANQFLYPKNNPKPTSVLHLLLEKHANNWTLQYDGPQHTRTFYETLKGKLPAFNIHLKDFDDITMEDDNLTVFNSDTTVHHEDAIAESSKAIFMIFDTHKDKIFKNYQAPKHYLESFRKHHDGIGFLKELVKEDHPVLTKNDITDGNALPELPKYLDYDSIYTFINALERFREDEKLRGREYKDIPLLNHVLKEIKDDSRLAKAHKKLTTKLEELLVDPSNPKPLPKDLQFSGRLGRTIVNYLPTKEKNLYEKDIGSKSVINAMKNNGYGSYNKGYGSYNKSDKPQDTKSSKDVVNATDWSDKLQWRLAKGLRCPGCGGNDHNVYETGCPKIALFANCQDFIKHQDPDKIKLVRNSYKKYMREREQGKKEHKRNTKEKIRSLKGDYTEESIAHLKKAAYADFRTSFPEDRRTTEDDYCASLEVDDSETIDSGSDQE